MIGQTQSSDFPTTDGAFERTINVAMRHRSYDAFALELNPTGSALVYSTFLA